MTSNFPVVALASVLLLAACGGTGASDASDALRMLPVTNSVVAAVETIRPAPVAATLTASLPATPSFDGKWSCASDYGPNIAFDFEISGNALGARDGSATAPLSHGKGIEVHPQLISYRDPKAGTEIHTRAVRQVEKSGYASIFSPEAHAGAGAGVEFSLNPNDTIKISDYSSMASAETVQPAIPMTCHRIRA